MSVCACACSPTMHVCVRHCAACCTVWEVWVPRCPPGGELRGRSWDEPYLCIGCAAAQGLPACRGRVERGVGAGASIYSAAPDAPLQGIRHSHTARHAVYWSLVDTAPSAAAASPPLSLP